MTLIKVPKPPKSAYNPNRPISALLKAQVEYLHEAERRLPLSYRSEIYINAIKTEGEASKYIREVTEAIHEAHAQAAGARARVPAKRKRVIEIAAVADERAERKRTGKKLAKKSSGTSRRKR